MSVSLMRGLMLLLAGTLACASSGATESGNAAGARTVRSPNVITAEEISALSASNAYEIVQRLRPQWLRNSGVASIQGGSARQGALVAYLDNVRLSRFDEMRSIAAGSIRSIRYLNAEQAQALDTTAGLVVGAVVVSTK